MPEAPGQGRVLTQEELDAMAAEQAAQDAATMAAAPVASPAYDPAQDPQAAYTAQPASIAPLPYYDPAQDPQSAYTGQPYSTAPVPPPPYTPPPPPAEASPSTSGPPLTQQYVELHPPPASDVIQTSYPSIVDQESWLAQPTTRHVEPAVTTYAPAPASAAQASEAYPASPEEFLANLARAEDERKLAGLFGGAGLRDYYAMIRSRSKLPTSPRTSDVAPI